MGTVQGPTSSAKQHSKTSNSSRIIGIQSLVLIQLLESIIYHAAVEKLEYDGVRFAEPGVAWELLAESIEDGAQKLISALKLRWVALLLYKNASSIVPPQDNALTPLPPLTKLNLRAISAKDRDLAQSRTIARVDDLFSQVEIRSPNSRAKKANFAPISHTISTALICLLNCAVLVKDMAENQ
ncbi:hypothetical protein DL96DRAFT_1566402 [Flagelloscypha sp. PMI_526]|nr:hypothetical protein DL96DRAFT_1566402 [Flagelloscypha sp. PMI_526]